MTRGRRPRAIAIAIAAIAVLGGSPARAADIGVVADTPDPFVERLVLELEQLGLTVTRTTTIESSRDVIVLEVGPTSIALHELREHGVRKKRAIVAAKRDPIEVAEEVHALLLPLVAAPVPASPAAAPAPAADPVPSESTTASAKTDSERPIELGAGAGAIVGAASPGIALSVDGAFFPSALRTKTVMFGASASGLFTVVPESLSGSGGSADVRPFVFAAEAVVRFGSRSRFGLDAAAGVALHHLSFEGHANAPFRSQTDSATCVSPTLRARGGHSFDRLRVFVEARTGFVFPDIAIRLGGNDASSWGRPWAYLGGGATFAF